MALPPLFEGGVNAILTCVSPRVIAPIVGGSGTVRGIKVVDTIEEEPDALSAFNWRVYVVPFVNVVVASIFVILKEVSVAGTIKSYMPSIVYTYCVIAFPPLSAEGINTTKALLSPKVTDDIAGEEGTVRGIKLVVDVADGPRKLTARNWRVYEYPLLKSVILKEVSVTLDTET